MQIICRKSDCLFARIKSFHYICGIILKNSIMQTAALTPYQKLVVGLMANVDEAQQKEISSLLANYFAQKAFDAADALWDSGMIGESTIEEWKHEHMRTPYHE